MTSPTAPPSREYDDYNASPGLEQVSRAVFGSQYRGQKSSLWPQDLIDLAAGVGLDHTGHFLDAGCGAGWASDVLSEHFGCTGEAWDVSQTNVDLATSLNSPGGRVRVRRRDFHDADGVEQKFTLIVSIGSAYWTDHPEQLAQDWRSMLRPGGTIVVFLTQSLGEDGTTLTLPGASAAAASCDWPSVFAEADLAVETLDHTTRFTSWLDRWILELDTRHDALVVEMGEQEFDAFRRRFTSMAEAASRGRLRRTVVLARLETTADTPSDDGRTQ